MASVSSSCWRAGTDLASSREWHGVAMANNAQHPHTVLASTCVRLTVATTYVQIDAFLQANLYFICSIRPRRLVQIVVARIQWNPAKKQSVVAWELKISKMFNSGVLRIDLGVKAYQQSTSLFLTLHLKEQSVIQSKCHFQHYADNGQRRISFHRWKYLQYWGGFSQYIDRVYASTSWETHDKAPRIHVMVLLGSVVWSHHQAPFLWKGGENLCQSLWDHSVRAYCEAFNNTLFSNEHWSFMQDLAPARKANSTKVWLQGIFRTQLLWVILGLLTLQQLWPQSDGLQEWTVLEGMFCKKRHPNIEILKRSLMKAMADFPK